MVDLNHEKLKIKKSANYIKDTATGLMVNCGYEEYVILEEHKNGHTQIHKKHLLALDGKAEKEWKKAGHDVKKLRELKVVK